MLRHCPATRTLAWWLSFVRQDKLPCFFKTKTVFPVWLAFNLAHHMSLKVHNKVEALSLAKGMFAVAYIENTLCFCIVSHFGVFGRSQEDNVYLFSFNSKYPPRRSRSLEEEYWCRPSACLLITCLSWKWTGCWARGQGTMRLSLLIDSSYIEITEDGHPQVQNEPASQPQALII